ncbi:hypothetical protein [Candidatus Thiosymbion oneisti]|uniref:hypothetical protein n=1 Tax=Candidatus Thiosymbion oneisti TaxID=589554 RepID=UPI0010609478|nr:hypothetical protein [Candidatus Thiosymbion oneisti]
MITDGEKGWNDWVWEPLLGSVLWYQTLPIESERKTVDRLLTQIDQALGKEVNQDSSNAGYLLVPASDPGRFSLLWYVLKKDEDEKRDADARKALCLYRTKLDSDYPLSPFPFLIFSLPWQQWGKWLEEIENTPVNDQWIFDWLNNIYRPDIDELNLVEWAELISWAKDKLAAPFAHLSRELGFHLRSPASNEQEAQTKLVSELILEAFADADPRLAFDVSRLRQFREVLQVYRYLLDGDVIPRARPALDTASPESALAAPSPGSTNLKNLPTLFWIALAGILLLILTVPVWRTLSSLARALVNWRYLTLSAEAEGFLEQLAYRSSRESSAGLSWKGINLGRKQTLAAQDLTLPGLTTRYTSFLDQVRRAYNGKAVIAIDELDKIHDPEQVKELLTEIKGALFVPGIFYLISISEDAARSFRRRLASGQDIFESTFDEIIDVRQIGVATAVAMLERREETGEDTERLPRACLEVAALFGGGIPREIIRARRTLSFAEVGAAGRTRRWAARILLKEELEQWEGHLGEANLSGADTIAIRRHARAAAECLQAGDDSEATYGKIRKALEPGIEIIDPQGLRHTVGYQAEGIAANTEAKSGDGPTPEQQAAAYRHIAGDLQTLLRLLILTHLGERIVCPDEPRENYEARILECHRALADKPALAETLLDELRKGPDG